MKRSIHRAVIAAYASMMMAAGISPTGTQVKREPPKPNRLTEADQVRKVAAEDKRERKQLKRRKHDA